MPAPFPPTGRLARLKEKLTPEGCLESVGVASGLRSLKAVSREKLKALVGVAQLTAVFTKKENLGGEFPQVFVDFTLTFFNWTTLDFLPLLSPDCAFQATFLQKFALRLALPSTVVGSLVAYVCWLSRKLRVAVDRRTRHPSTDNGSAEQAARKQLHTVYGWISTFVFAVFVSASANIFSVFRCEPMADGLMHLSGDLEHICGEGDHVFYSVVAGVGVLCYPIGVPMGLFYCLWSLHRAGTLHAGDDKEEAHESAKFLGAMFHPYKPSVYWFEVVQLLFKVRHPLFQLHPLPPSLRHLLAPLLHPPCARCGAQGRCSSWVTSTAPTWRRAP